MEIIDYKYLFLDMNAYFASVEQQDNITLRGRPVVVTPYTGSTGCVIASSYEAKRLGVKTGNRVGEARQKIPAVAVIEARARRYVEVHKQIKKTLAKISPFVTARSVDEFCLLVPASLRNQVDTTRLAHEIKTAIKTEVGEWLTASVGIGPNEFLAKLGTDLQKPDGLVFITTDNIDSIFRQIDDLTTLCGINYRSALKLQLSGILTPYDFFHTSPQRLRELFGIMGERWYMNLHGAETIRIAESLKSVGHSYILPPDLRSQNSARQVVLKLATKVAARLKRHRLLCNDLHLGARSFKEKSYYHNHKRMDNTNNRHVICKTALRLFETCPIDAPFYLGVTATNLSTCKREQLSLLDDTSKIESLDDIANSINDRFGPETVIPASLLTVDGSAPYRVGFNSLDEPVTKK